MEEMNQTVAEGAVTKRICADYSCVPGLLCVPGIMRGRCIWGLCLEWLPFWTSYIRISLRSVGKHISVIWSFNCTPQVTGFIMGLAASMEEQEC